MNSNITKPCQRFWEHRKPTPANVLGTSQTNPCQTFRTLAGVMNVGRVMMSRNNNINQPLPTFWEHRKPTLPTFWGTSQTNPAKRLERWQGYE